MKSDIHQPNEGQGPPLNNVKNNEQKKKKNLNKHLHMHTLIIYNF